MRSILKIDGGIGRVICATGAIKKLSSLDPQDEIVIITSWPEVFENNPYVLKLYKDGSIPYLFDDVIKYGIFSYPEPYHDWNYYTQNNHLIQSFNYLITGYSNKVDHEIFLTEEEKKFGFETIAKVKQASGKSSVIAYQPFGSGASMTQEGVISDPSFRSLNHVTSKKILDECSSSVFINLSHIPINHPNCWQQQYTLRQLFAVAHACDGIVSIDSVLSHLGVAFKKKGVLILGATYRQNVGYDEIESYTTHQREGYPKSYQSNRFGGHIELNQDAMLFDSPEMQSIINDIEIMGAKSNDNSSIMPSHGCHGDCGCKPK